MGLCFVFDLVVGYFRHGLVFPVWSHLQGLWSNMTFSLKKTNKIYFFTVGNLSCTYTIYYYYYLNDFFFLWAKLIKIFKGNCWVYFGVPINITNVNINLLFSCFLCAICTNHVIPSSLRSGYLAQYAPRESIYTYIYGLL